MRAYTVATVAVTLHVPLKWVDNVITHHHLSGVTRARQGIPRRLTQRAVVASRWGAPFGSPTILSLARAGKCVTVFRRQVPST
jgi:hypothetical protein